MLFATLAIALATGMYTHYAAKQWKTMQGQLDQMKGGSAQTDHLITETHDLAVAAQRQLTVMQQQLEVSERPWVSLAMDRLSISPLSFGPDGGEARINYLMRNTGKSPALKANLRAKMFIYSPDRLFAQIAEEQAALRKMMSAPNYPETTIFPGDTIPGNPPVMLYPNEISAGLKDQESGPFRLPGLIFMAVAICVDYQFPFSPKHHQTEYIFMIQRPEGVVAMGAFKPEGTLSGIRLTYFSESAN